MRVEKIRQKRLGILIVLVIERVRGVVAAAEAAAVLGDREEVVDGSTGSAILLAQHEAAHVEIHEGELHIR